MRTTRDAARAAAIPRPSALGAYLRRLPVAPCEVAALLGGGDAYAAFRRIVREIVPAAEAEILATEGATAFDREIERCGAFARRVEAEYFPCYEFEEYAQIACGVPFVRFGWGYDDFHNLDLALGKLLLLALCEQPYPTGFDTRIPLLDAVGAVLPAELLARIPHEGIPPTALHERLDGGRFAAAAEFADWLWSDTGTIFLDADQEVEVYDAEWSREVVLALAEQWRTAQAIMDRVKALEDWLELGAPRHFAELLDAALGTTPSPNDRAHGQGAPRVIEPGESHQRRSHANDTSAHAAGAAGAAGAAHPLTGAGDGRAARRHGPDDVPPPPSGSS